MRKKSAEGLEDEKKVEGVTKGSKLGFKWKKKKDTEDLEEEVFKEEEEEEGTNGNKLGSKKKRLAKKSSKKKGKGSKSRKGMEKQSCFHFLRYLSPKNLNKAMEDCGAEFSMSGFLKYILIVFAGIVAFAYYFKLQWGYIAFLSVLFLLFVPNLFLNTYRNMFEEKKFEDITIYMEQMLYSFQRRSKILNALEDTMQLYEEGSLMYNCIYSAVDYIQTSSTEGDLYKEAFFEIEKEYGCARLVKIHDFMIKVENSGGDFTKSIEILLSDRNMWMNRVYSLLRDKKNVKVKATIIVGLAFLIMALGMSIAVGQFAVHENPISQVVTTLAIVLNMVIWYVIQIKMSGSLLNVAGDLSEDTIKRYYNTVFYKDMKKAKKNALISAIILIPVIPLAYFKLGTVVAAMVAVTVYFLATQPKGSYKTAMKQIRKEVEKVFPEWLLSLSLQLQIDNVFISIGKTKDDAPYVLREELNILYNGLIEESGSNKPYLNFLKKLQIPDISSAMKILYSMSEYGYSDINSQIGSLVDRNAMLIDKAEKIRNDDFIAGISFLTMLPMFSCVLKLLTDMAIMMLSLLSMMSTI